ncbi:unnamed protein product [Effrenium voratum]|uniref:Uncharacterized protein n=1 Tax=Effrenium voratum TaxID=2562239 RepID=A0AA36MQ31_9DINO|nr:unnamed protein product [Effrenium voratum]
MTHDTATRELESAHRQQEAELREFIDSLGQTHKKVLEERMRAHEEKEAAQKDAIGLLHQQIADKGSEMRNCLEKLRHQQKLLEESETSHRIKEEAAQTAMESLQQKLAEKEIEMENRERVQQAVLQDKEAFFRQQDGSLREMIESLRRQLAEKEANLRDTFQSMQLLQNTAGEQLRLEQQRVHKLEAEVKDLRDQLDELRSSSLAGSHRADMAESELASSRQLVQELRQAVQRLEGEKDQQFEKASERQAALQEEIVHLRTRFGGLQQESLASCKRQPMPDKPSARSLPSSVTHWRWSSAATRTIMGPATSSKWKPSRSSDLQWTSSASRWTSQKPSCRFRRATFRSIKAISFPWRISLRVQNAPVGSSTI